MIKSLLQRIYSFNIRERFLFNPFVYMDISSLGNYQGINTGVKRNLPVIVSIYAASNELKNMHLTIYSLLNQTMKPDKIILWVDDSEDLQSLSYEITQFIKNGLEIKFVKELGPYTAAYNAIKDYSESINVIAQNGFYYPTTWLKKLYASYIQYSEDIQVHIANRVKLKENKVFSSKFWEKEVKKDSADFSYIMNNNGGILFPPNCFGNDFLRTDIFLKYAPVNSELWYWVMSLVYGRKIRVVKNALSFTISVDILKFIKYKEDLELKDKQLEDLLKFYQQNVITKLS